MSTAASALPEETTRSISVPSTLRSFRSRKSMTAFLSGITFSDATLNTDGAPSYVKKVPCPRGPSPTRTRTKLSLRPSRSLTAIVTVGLLSPKSASRDCPPSMNSSAESACTSANSLSISGFDPSRGSGSSTFHSPTAGWVIVTFPREDSNTTSRTSALSKRTGCLARIPMRF